MVALTTGRPGIARPTGDTPRRRSADPRRCTRPGPGAPGHAGRCSGDTATGPAGPAVRPSGGRGSRSRRDRAGLRRQRRDRGPVRVPRLDTGPGAAAGDERRRPLLWSARLARTRPRVAGQRSRRSRRRGPVGRSVAQPRGRPGLPRRPQSAAPRDIVAPTAATTAHCSRGCASSMPGDEPCSTASPSR